MISSNLEEALKVLMIAPTPFFGDRGCHVRILEEIRALGEKGVRVLLLTYPAGKDASGVEIRRLKNLFGLSRERIGPDFGKFFLDAEMIFDAISAARSFKPDIIHGHLHEGCLIGWLVRQVLDIPLVFDYQGSLSGEMSHHDFFKRGSLPFTAFHHFEKLIDRLASMVLVSSGAMLRAEAGRRSSRWRTVLDAVDTDMFRPLGRDLDLADRLGLPRDRQICVFLGLLNSYQGVDLLLDAVTATKNKSDAKIHFLIMGYPSEELYQARAAVLGVEDCVTFPGRIPYEDAPKYLNLGDIAVAPKIAATESNGKVIDYMACGLPTVALDTTTNRELMGEAGIYVPWRGREDIAAVDLAEALVSLAKDENLRKKLGTAGRERVEMVFNRERLAKDLLAAYDLTLGNYELLRRI